MGWWVPQYIAQSHPQLGRPGPVRPYMPASLRRGLTVAVGRLGCRQHAGGAGPGAGRAERTLSLIFIYQNLPGLPMALRVSGRLTVLPTS
ncbi:DUF6875 domain-containing protein [Streptomyces sp. NPDC051976]|uniref:DUF6875 domain-containing protein n=1 Tax=Streptomyces sp. NPDC051976 TaxID=3154947 RepID=UPI00341D317B